jgi:uncharacterized protein YegP (UPF0339 family)
MFDTIKTWLHRNTIRIEMIENNRDKWQWRLRAANGEILAHSEEYSSYGSCIDTANMLIGKSIRMG